MTSHIGYKKIQDGYIVKMRIDGKNNELRDGVKRQNANCAKNRCSKAFVLDIYHMNDKKKIDSGYGLRDKNFSYKVGEYVEVDNYDDDLTKVCSTGIHYFLSEEPAFFWKLNTENYTGEYKSYHDNGELRCQQFYKNGLSSGEYKEYHDNGQLRRQTFYKDGKNDGEFKDYYRNGQLRCQRFYKNGLSSGEYKSYHDNGELRCQQFYKNGLSSGEYKDYYRNGQLKCQQFYKDGLPHGEYKYYYENGQLKCQQFYKDGLSHGECKWYYGNGQLYCQTFYKDGLSQDSTRLETWATPWRV